MIFAVINGMWPTFVIFTVPFAVLASLLLNEAGIRAHRQSEQLRLDALVLSFCHHRSRFLQDHVEGPNTQIRIIQLAMKSAGYPCYAATLAGNILLATSLCPVARSILRVQSVIGRAVENRQDLGRAFYSARQAVFISNLKIRNHLVQKFGSLKLQYRPLIEMSDGLKREQLSALLFSMETFFGLKWPRRLGVDDSFAFFHTISAELNPHHSLAGVHSSDRRLWRGFRTFKHQALVGKTATSVSGCKLSARPPYEVIQTQ